MCVCLQMSEMRETLMEGKGGKAPGRGEAPCADGKRAVLDCYMSHSGSPMHCARQVQAFADCVDKHRANTVEANRG